MNQTVFPAVILPVVLLLAITASVARAETNYLGATAILQKLAEKPTADAGEKKEMSESAKLKHDVEAFKKELASLKPEDAASRWLTLFDRQTKLGEDGARSSYRSFMSGEDGTEGFNPQDLWPALPSPVAWDALRKAVEVRPAEKGQKAIRETALRLFAHTLVADRAAQTNDVAAMEALFEKLGWEESYALAGPLDQIATLLAENSDDSAAVLKSLERKLSQISAGENKQELSVPDLVTLAGMEKAEALLRRSLVKPNVEIEIANGEETKKLARRLALELVGKLKTPQWKLACSLDAVELYEALEKQFTKADEAEAAATANEPVLPVPGSFSSRIQSSYGSKSEARMYYFLGLIVAGRSKDAAALAQKMGMGENDSLPQDALKQLEHAGHARELHDFFLELLTQNPDLPFWDDYIQLAAKVGETGQMLTLARKAAARDDVSDSRHRLIRQNLVVALFAADEVDEGIKEIRQVLAEKEPDNVSRYNYRVEDSSGLATRLARLGQLLERPELIEEGLARLRAAVSNQPPADGYTGRQQPVQLAGLLAEIGRGPEAETILAEALTKAAQAKEDSESDPNEPAQQPYLLALAGLYHHAGRFADVLALLDQSSGWGVKDLAAIHNHSCGLFQSASSHGPETDSLGQVAADSLLAAGRKIEARKVIDVVLDAEGGSDPAYKVLLKTGDSADVMARLDAIFAHDQFEERPLIWKAYLLQQAGKLEEAEAIVRRAIAIDPSDGEQGPGDRMRAYAILSEIRAARGDTNQATLFRGAVDAIRLSENADRFYNAGLLKRAVKMYEESLTHFADAYCIQSRLALRLSELGMHEAAEEHYRRAYELMPESFGRVESHCFGCERAFDGERAQGIAEKVFTRLAKKTPEKPQVHYLLGYLREEQGLYPEALKHYRDAVKLDPDYLSAWKKILEISTYQHIPASDKGAVALNLFRLDPFGRHSSCNFSGVTDLRALWGAVETAAKSRPAKLESIYPLAASKAGLEKKEAEARDGKSSAQRRYTHYYRSNSRDEKGLQPASAVLQNEFINAVMPLLGGRANYYGMDID